MFFWVAAVGYASEAAPLGLSATAQALMGAAQSGLGWSLGSVIAGYLWDNTNGHVIFFFAAFTFILATLIFWLGNRDKKQDAQYALLIRFSRRRELPVFGGAP